MGLTKSTYIDYLIQEDEKSLNQFSDLTDLEIDNILADLYEIEVAPFGSNNPKCNHKLSDFPLHISGLSGSMYYFCTKCGEALKLFIP